MTPLEAEVLRDIEPTPTERAAMAQDASILAEAATRRLADLAVPGTASVQGSVAKDTWLRNAGDIDLFLLLDEQVPAARLESIAEEVGRGLLQGVHKRYAQHPYLMGHFRDRLVDLVPAYRVAQASAKMSAVDRTPFHTAWMQGHLDDDGRAQARLLKQWLKGIGAYGAQTAIGGFSGYLAEVLIVHFGSFSGVVAWLAAGGQPRRITLGSDQVQDQGEPLVVVDPVDPARNCAAAVQPETLELAVEAARAYQREPDRRHFFPPSLTPVTTSRLHDALRLQGVTWLAALLRPRTNRLDIVLPQFQKGARAIAAALAHAGFPVHRMQCQASEDGAEVLLQWLASAEVLPATRLHKGPPPGPHPNAQRFREKWEGHSDANGPVHEADGRLQVEVRVPSRSAPEWLAANLDRVGLGKHVMDALPDAQVLTLVAEVPAHWAAQASEFILARRPWQR